MNQTSLNIHSESQFPTCHAREWIDHFFNAVRTTLLVYFSTDSVNQGYISQ